MSGKSKYCPLLVAADILSPATNRCDIDCMKEQCAWWIEDKQKCVIAATGGKK